jgi:hypothetical protein
MRVGSPSTAVIRRPTAEELEQIPPVGTDITAVEDFARLPTGTLLTNHYNALFIRRDDGMWQSLLQSWVTADDAKMAGAPTDRAWHICRQDAVGTNFVAEGIRRYL